jgi:hypothetical protein
MTCAETVGHRLAYKALLVIPVLIIVALTITGCTGKTSPSVVADTASSSPGDIYTDSSAVALRFVDAMLKRDLTKMKALIVPEQAKLVESSALDLRTGHGANPSIAYPPKVDPKTAVQEDTGARYDILVGLWYGNDTYRYRVQVRLQRTHGNAWLVNHVQVNRIQ